MTRQQLERRNSKSVVLREAENAAGPGGRSASWALPSHVFSHDQHSPPGLTPRSAARSAALSAPPGTHGSPPHSLPSRALGPPWIESGVPTNQATRGRSGSTCSWRRGGDNRTSSTCQDLVARLAPSVSPQRRLPGGECAALRLRAPGEEHILKT